MRFALRYVLLPLVMAVGAVGLFTAAVLFGVPWLIGLDGARWLFGGLCALCLLALAGLFLQSAWDRYLRDQRRGRAQ